MVANAKRRQWNVDSGNGLEPCPGWMKVVTIDGLQVQCPDCGRRFTRRYASVGTGAIPPHKRPINQPAQ